MKKNNYITYYCALMLWELHVLYNAVGDIITSPIKYQYAFLYDRCRWVRKMLEKQGFTSSEDVRIRFDSWSKSQDKKYFEEYEHPVHSYFPDTNMYFLCVFFVHSTILVISNCVFGVNPPKFLGPTYGIYGLLAIFAVALVFEYYFISRKDKAKKLFKQFDKWKQPKRRRMQWLAFGLIVAICGYQVLTMWLFLR
ncbi:MAG: hypothetical protein IKL19_00555 [Paludibacteraceae bacterium]|nr:hypothetical protein [Paludibacteraceae bacterium]